MDQNQFIACKKKIYIQFENQSVLVVPLSTKIKFQNSAGTGNSMYNVGFHCINILMFYRVLENVFGEESGFQSPSVWEILEAQTALYT